MAQLLRGVVGYETESAETRHSSRRRLPSRTGFYILLHVNESREREDIATLLKRVMSEHRLSQKDIADRSGIPFQTISAWVSRKRKPSLSPRGKDQLRALAGALPGVSVADAFEAAGATVPGELDAAAEERVLRIYRNLPPSRRKVADGVLESLAAED